MTRLITLIAYDLRMLRRDRGALLLMAAALLLALYGLFEGVRFQRHTQAAQRAAAAQESGARRAAEDLAARYFADPDAPEFAALLWYRTPVDVRGYALREHVAFASRPLLPGAGLAIGQADVQPPTVRVRAESMDSVRTAGEIEHPARLAAGRYDLAYFTVYLWPLMLLSLCASVLTRERESRRLRSLLLQGVRPGLLLAAQAGARSLLATVLLVAAVGAAALAAGSVPATGAGLAALGWWSAVTLAYSTFWAAVAMAVCALAADRPSAAFAGFGLWLLFAVVLPGALDAALRIGAPLPARERYVQALRDAGDRVAADGAASLARFYDRHPQWKPRRTALDQVPASVSRLQRAQELELAMRGVDAEFAAAQAARAGLSARLSAFSPATLASQAFATVAGNDAARYQDFIGEVASYQGGLRDFFQGAIQRAALGDERAPCPRTCLGGYGFRDFDRVPLFAASPGLARQAPPPARTLALLAWAAAFAALAPGALRLARARHDG
ncbi:ABC transporter permease subunit [Massilia forsythiae]|uniref:ABC transporter permease subunit n=1 Tax=Massilia forsythiae TaxID=2728020 RepID=A0A7Z2VY80_9BURK|nr:DUF3526 domain-containing protein [Massilia forsythiae]QJE01607.1 ABC transporter permease subunit [Massilia forsythiae]